MRKKELSYTDLIQLAKVYHVSENPLFTSSARRYVKLQKIIEVTEKEILSQGLLTTKIYVKSRENTYCHPLLKEIPRLEDAANKTLQTMLSIIEKLGTVTPPKSSFEQTLADFTAELNEN